MNKLVSKEAVLSSGIIFCQINKNHNYVVDSVDGLRSTQKTRKKYECEICPLLEINFVHSANVTIFIFVDDISFLESILEGNQSRKSKNLSRIEKQ